MPLPSSGYAKATLANPSSAQADYTAVIDLATMPQSWWDAIDTADPTKGRAARDSDEQELAVDWLEIDTVAQTGKAAVLWTGTLATTGDHVVRLYPPQAANASVAAGDTFGQHAAYDSGWVQRLPLHEGSGSTAEDRTINGYDGSVVGASWSNGGLVFTGTNALEIPVAAANAVADAGTLIAFIDYDGDPNINGHVFDSRQGGNTGWDLWLQNDFDITLDTGGEVSINTTTMPSAGLSSFAGTYDGSTVTIGFNGSTFSSANITGSATRSGTTAPAWGNQYNRGRPLGANQTLREAQLHSVVRDDAWRAHFHLSLTDQASFWGTWTWVAPGGDVTLTADPGAVALAGTDAALVHGLRLSADSGALPVTGTETGLQRDAVLSTDPGAVDLSGTDADLSIQQQTHYFDLPGAAGDWVSTPDDPSLRITGDIDVRGRILPDDWNVDFQTIIAKDSNTGSPDRAWLFILINGGLRFAWSPNGDENEFIGQDSVAITPPASGPLWVRVTVDVDNGNGEHVVTFYTSEDGATWTVLGSPFVVTGTTQFPEGLADLGVGARTNGNDMRFAGRIYRAMVWDGFGGTPLVDVSGFDSQGASPFTSASGQTWTIHGNVTVEGGGLITLSADPGAVALSGTAVDLLRDTVLSADAGAVPVTGTNADLLRNLRVVAGSGSVPVAGTDVALARAFSILSDPGAVPLAGTVADLLRSAVLTADPGSVALAGTFADLLRTLLLTADAGNVALVGTAVDLVAVVFAPPENFQAVVVSDTQVDLSWDANALADSYDVERNGVEIERALAVTSYSDLDLTPGTDYAYRVRSVREIVR